MDHVSSLTTLRGGPRMNDMFNVVHIDEKWVHLTKVKQKIYLLPHEVGPERNTQSKKIIPKIMFLCAAARPRFDTSKSQYFDDKIGLWPLIHQVPAARNNKNRSKGTLITKPKIVDRNEFRCMLVEKVIPAIKVKWPGNKEDIIWIQQDNAKPHTTPSDVVVAAAGMEGGWSIQLKNQPPNSPDLNILDLGFFNTIQSLQYEKAPRDIDELIAVVVDSFHGVTSEKLDNNFLTLQKVMECIMEYSEGNNYKLPHMQKAKKRREGRLEISIRIDQEVYEKAFEEVNAMYECLNVEEELENSVFWFSNKKIMNNSHNIIQLV